MFGQVQNIGGYAEGFRTRPRTCAAKAGNHFIENQQDIVLITNLAQAFQIAFGRDHHTCGTGKRLHNHRCDIRSIVQRNQIQQAVGQRFTAFGLALHKRTCRRLGVRQMVGINALAEHLAVAADTAHRNAAEVHAMIAFFTTDQQALARLAAQTPIRARNFQRCIGRFRAGTGEKHPIQTGGHVFDDFVGQRKRSVVAELEGRRIIQLRRLLGNRFGDFAAAVA